MRNSNIPSPCFVLEATKLEANLKLLQEVQLEAEIDIILAFKGFAMWHTFPLISKYLKGASASSLHEVKLCADKMQYKAHTYAVAYIASEIDEILQHSSQITFNSLAQYEQYKEKALAQNVSCGLRINPEQSDVGTELYNPSFAQSRLGITIDNFPKDLPHGIDGLHFHVLCESDSFALEEVLKSIEEKYGKFLPHLKWLNMGGGHLITSKDYDIPHLISLLKAFKEKYDIAIMLEPGSAVAWKTGFLKTTVIDIVSSGGIKTAIIDASFTCHMPDCLEMPYRPEIVGANKNAAHAVYKYRIGGVSCLAGDFIEAYGFDKKLQIGDEIIFEDMMHYTMVKTSTFNGIQHPAIGLLKSSGEFEVVRTFGYEDYRNRLS